MQKKKKSKTRVVVPSDFNLCYKPTVTKAVLFQHETDSQISEQNSPEKINVYVVNQSMTKQAKYTMGERQPF